MAVLNPPSFMQNRTDHTAQQDRLFLAGLVVGGVGGLSSPLVRAQASPNMSVIVAEDRFWMPGTQDAHQGTYHGYNDGDVTVTLSAAHGTLPRKDIIVAYVADAFYTGSDNEFVIDNVTGSAAASPVEPAVPANGIKVATIDVAAGATSITNANIVNNAVIARSALASSPWVCTSSTRPSNPFESMLIYENDTENLMLWDGGAWDLVLIPGTPGYQERTAETTIGINTWSNTTPVISYSFKAGGWYEVIGSCSGYAGGATATLRQRILASGVKVSPEELLTAELNQRRSANKSVVFQNTGSDKTVNVSHQLYIENPATGFVVGTGAMVSVKRIG